MSSWIDKYPKRLPKSDLIGIKLMLGVNHAPVDTNLPGDIKQITLFNFTDTSLSYTVLVTAQDLEKMIEAHNKKKPFVFEFEKPDDKYPGVREAK